MTDTFIQLPIDGTGKQVRAFSGAVGPNTVYEQAFVLCDSSMNVIGVLNSSPAGTEYGLVTRNIPSGTQAVSGTVSVSNLPGTQPVSGSVSVSNFPATQPVSGTVLAEAVDANGLTPGDARQRGAQVRDSELAGAMQEVCSALERIEFILKAGLDVDISRDDELQEAY